MKRINLIYGVVLVALLTVLAGFIYQAAAPEQLPQMPSALPYNLHEPAQKIKLPEKLREISGITWWDKHQLAGVQDEDGYIFVIDTLQGEVVKQEKFRKDGDYEGIARVGSKLYIVRSDGDLYKVKDFDQKDQKTKEYETPLKTANDVEGLCYSKADNELWLACKEQPGLEKDKHKGTRAIYRFDLEEKKLKKKPKFLIDLKALTQFLNNKYSKDKKRWEFRPSGLAIHPVSKQLYVLAHGGSLLIVLDHEGTLVDAEALPKKLFRQPEGIAFSPNGDLYISNEGVDKKANILRFTYQP